MSSCFRYGHIIIYGHDVNGYMRILFLHFYPFKTIFPLTVTMDTGMVWVLKHAHQEDTK